jgi:MFS family permease
MPPPGARPEPTRGYRWLVLLAVSVAIFGNYYVFDALNPVGPLLESQLGFTQAQIGRLDTAYNVAALLVLMAGGVVIDRVGTKRAMVAFAVVTAAGGAFIAFGRTPALMAAGRFVLGLGAEPLIVAATTVLGRWFKGKELSFAMGMNLAIARLGSVAADSSRVWAAPLFESWQRPLFLAALVATASVGAAVAYAALERRAEGAFAPTRGGPSDRLVLADLVRFDRGYWYVVALCVTFYSAVFPFRRFANILLADVHGVSQEAAAALNGALPLAAMIATPLFGILVDYAGRRALLMTAGSALLVPTFLLVGRAGVAPIVPIALLGVAFSLVPAIMWPAVAYLVDEKRLGTAYALMTFCQQVGWGAVSWALGGLNDASGAGAGNAAGYAPGLRLLAGLGLVGLLFSALLWRTERGPRARGLETITARHHD